jgi:hypothetical protein
VQHPIVGKNVGSDEFGVFHFLCSESRGPTLSH